jgi:single-strand DNA-binding protein
MNKVFLLGAAVERPELRKAKSGSVYCELKLATSERKRAVDGILERAVRWHKVLCFGQVAQMVSEQVRTGTAVMVEGRLETKVTRRADGSEMTQIQVFASAVEFPEGRLRRRGARVAAVTAMQARAESGYEASNE